MSNYIHIYLQTSDDAMMGADGWEGYDKTDSVKAFAQAVEQAVIDAYPGADVDVTTYASCNSVESDVAADDAILEIAQSVWSSFSWLRS